MSEAEADLCTADSALLLSSVRCEQASVEYTVTAFYIKHSLEQLSLFLKDVSTFYSCYLSSLWCMSDERNKL